MTKLAIGLNNKLVCLSQWYAIVSEKVAKM